MQHDGGSSSHRYPTAREIKRHNGKITGREVAWYDYRDEQGLLLFQTVRFDPKSFAYRQPDGKGGWV